MQAKAKELGNNVATSVNDMNAKVLEAANNKAAVSTSSAASATSPAPVVTASDKPASGSIANASREELMEILQKMNKKVKALSTLRSQLTEKAQAAEQDRDKLIQIFQKEVLDGMDLSSLDPDQPQAEQLLNFWKQKDQQNKEQLQSLRLQMQALQSSNNGGSMDIDIGALREQLEQEHNRAMAAMKDQMAKEHANQIAQLKGQSETAPSTPAGDTNSSEIQILKEKHEQQINQLKQAAAAQLQTFKKKVAAARTAELEKVKKETRAQVETELQSTKGDEDVTKIRQQLEQKHEQDMKRIQEEIKAQAAQETEAQLSKILTTMSNQGKEHEEELERVRQSAQKELEEAQQKVQSLESSADDVAARLDAAQNQLRAMQEQHKVDVERLKKDMENDAKTREEQLKLQLVKKAKEEALAESKGASLEKEAEVAKIRTDLISQYQSEKAKMQEFHDAELERLRVESNKAATDLVEKVKSESETVKNQLVSSHQQEMEARIEELRSQLQKAHEAEIAKIHMQAQSGQSDEVKAMREKFALQAKKFQESAMEQQAQAVEKARRELQEAMTKALDQKEKEHQTWLQQQVDEHASTITQLKDETAKTIAEAKRSEIESLTSSYEIKLTTLRAASEKSAEELRSSLEREQGLNGQIEQLNSRLTALTDEKNAILDSAKDGETSNNNVMEESLAKQRLSFEQMLTDQKGRHEEQVKRLEATISELTAIRSEADKFKELTSAREKEISELQKTLEETDSLLQQEKKASNEWLFKATAYEEAESKNMIRIKDLESALEQSKAEIDHLNAAIENLRKSAEESRQSSSEEVRQANESHSTMQQQLLVAKETIQKLKSEHESALSILSNSNENLKQQLISFSNDAGATTAALGKAHEDLKKRLTDSEAALQAKEEDSKRLENQIGELQLLLQCAEKKTDAEKDEAERHLKDLLQQVENANTTIETLNREHEEAMTKVRDSVESSESWTSRITEVEQLLVQKEKDFKNTKLLLEEELIDVKKAQSAAEVEKQGIELRLKEMNSVVETLKQKHHAEIEKMTMDFAAKSNELERDLKCQTETQINEAIELAAKKHAEEVEQLKGKMADHIDNMKAQLTEKLNAERQKLKGEKDEAEQKDKKREEQLAKLASQVKGLSAAAKKERDEKISLQESMKAEIGKRQELAKEVANQKKLLEEAKQQSASSVAKEQQALQETIEKLRSELKAVQEDRNSKVNKVEELTGKLEALTNNLNFMAEDMKQKDEAILLSEKQKAKLDSTENEVADLRQQINKLKLELTKNTQLANRLQSEKEASERNHGQRTALMGMLEGQLAEVNEKNTEANAKLEAALYDLSQKDEVLQSLEEKLQATEAARLEAEKQCKEASESLIQSQKGTAKKNTMMVDSLQRELQQLQQSTARKSAAAQKLIQEREVECAALRSANNKLQQEVDRGSLSDRKIFELAELQSNRESAQLSEIEVRDNAIERLKVALLDRDGDLASAEKTVQEVEAQVEELGRVKRREDVNMDYLKSIVVQFLSKPPGTSERTALLPVLATLLQFDANDYKMIEEGKKSMSWWGGVEPKVIGGASSSSSAGFTSALADLSYYMGGTSVGSTSASNGSPPQPPVASAEISVTSSASKSTGGTGRTTSLQF